MPFKKLKENINFRVKSLLSIKKIIKEKLLELLIRQVPKFFPLSKFISTLFLSTLCKGNARNSQLRVAIIIIAIMRKVKATLWEVEAMDQKIQRTAFHCKKSE